MTYIGTKGQKKQGRPWLALSVFAIWAVAVYLALTMLFPVELHQVVQWLQAKFAALRR
ncbi:hypothetical protein [Lysobacter tyrosinilyticus]